MVHLQVLFVYFFFALSLCLNECMIVYSLDVRIVKLLL